MYSPRRSLLSAAVLVALTAGPAHAVLERMGPINSSTAVGGFPAWYQDQTGVTLEYCDFLTASERDGAWCTANAGSVPETFPTDFGAEHFYYAATNDMRDAGNGVRARLVLGLEAGFSNGFVPLEGDQITFGRHRVVIPNLPFDGDYRVITPYGEKTYYDMKAGDKIADTSDIGLGCVATFECTLKTAIGPFLLPSSVPGGPEVPPMPDLKTVPAGTDPFYDALVAAGGTTLDPQTGKKYLADPARLGTVTGSTLPDFIAYEPNGTFGLRNHNTFRVEVRTSSINHDGPVFYSLDGESNFTIAGRLMTGVLPGKVTPTRAAYKADGVGNVTSVDVFANASPTTQARLPAQPKVPPVLPVLSYFDQPCAGAVGPIDGGTGLPVTLPPPYGAPTGTPHPMQQQGTTFWAQSQPGGLPPTHVCIVDAAAHDAAGQTVPAYYLQRVTDTVSITTAGFDGPNNGTLSVTARSSDPTAILTLTGYGPSDPATPGTALASAAGTGLTLPAGSGSVKGLMAAPANLQVVSSKGGSTIRETDVGLGMTTGSGTGTGTTPTDPAAPPVIGTPVAVNDTANMFEDCSPTTMDMCGPGQSLAFDLIGNDTITVNGQTMLLRDFARQNLGVVLVQAQAPRLGVANMTADGMVNYVPNPNVSGTDSISYTVNVNGKVSGQAVLTINIAPVNDLPLAANVSGGAVISKPATLNLLATSTDLDGLADLKDAVIVSWPTQLGTKPTPVNGVVNFTPTTTGTYNIVFQARDAAGALSPNTASGSVTVVAAETIAFTKSIFTTAQLRWTVSGTDTVRAGQAMTVVYADGKTSGGVLCNGTATNPACVIGTTVVDTTGTWLLDRIITAGTTADPTSTTLWTKAPTSIKVFSSSPVLGGSGTATIVKK